MTLHVMNNSTNSGGSSTNNQIHIIHPGRNVDREDILQQFTQWDSYVESSHGHNTPIISPQQQFTTGYQPLPPNNNSTNNTSSTHIHHRVKRFPSIKSKDFTSNQELNKSGKKKRGSLFHKGFLKRSKFKYTRSKLMKDKGGGPKFRNRQEFNSCLNYIDLTSLINDQYHARTNQSKDSLSQDINSILFQSRFNHNPLSSQNVVLYKPQNNNKIVVNKLIPRDIYLNQNHIIMPLPRQNTIKRKLSKRHIKPSRTNTRHHRTLNIKRSNTLPPSIHQPAPLPPQQQAEVTGVWSQYLQAVITQRIALRLTLMNSQPASNTSSLLNCSHSNHSSIPSTSTQEKIKNY